MLPKRIGIDLGTANVLVYVKGRGIVVDEPAVVALANRDNTVVAVGAEARDMMGRTPETISVIRPMKDGVIADYLITEAMLRYFVNKVIGRLNIIKPEVMICIPAGVTSVERRAVADAAEQAGARRPARLIEEPLAAAIAYPDIVLVFAGTVLMQTGQAVEIIAITMAVYLTISLLISGIMNWYNKKIKLVER